MLKSRTKHIYTTEEFGLDVLSGDDLFRWFQLLIT